MNSIIREQAEYLGYNVDWPDIEAIQDRYSPLLHKDGQVWIRGVRSAIKAYFA